MRRWRRPQAWSPSRLHLRLVPKRKEGEDSLEAVVEHDLFLHLGIDLAHRLEVHAAARHLRCTLVRGVDLYEELRITAGAVDAVRGEALGLLEGLQRLPLRARNDLVVVGARLIDQLLPLLLRLIDLIERWLDRL